MKYQFLHDSYRLITFDMIGRKTDMLFCLLKIPFNVYKKGYKSVDVNCRK